MGERERGNGCVDRYSVISIDYIGMEIRESLSLLCVNYSLNCAL